MKICKSGLSKTLQMAKWTMTMTATLIITLITDTTTKWAMDVVSVTLRSVKTFHRKIIPTTAVFIRSGGSQKDFNLAMMTAEEDSARVSACTRQDTRMYSEK